jgi:beta-lactamase class A
VGARFAGASAFWIHDLRSGRTAGWNADTPMPAASTVKLAALAASLRARRADLRYDETQLAAWSSNLAANRILERLGYARIEAALRGLGMTHSTYPGPYRAGTAVASPHTRVTTAHDLGRALFALQSAALGRSPFLTRAAGRRALDLLRGSLPAGDNLGLLRPWLKRTAVAEKNGWLDDVRITAAIVYRPRGPVIVVVAAAGEDLKRYRARALGRDVWRAVS